MTDQLDFPVLEEAPQRTDVAVAATKAIDLSKIDLVDVALAQFGDWRTEVAAANKRLANIAWDVSTKAGLDDIKDVRNKQAKIPRAEANKTADALVSKMAGANKRVRAEQVEIVAAWDALAAPLTKIIDDREKVLADEKAERERIEGERVAGHIAKIASIKAAADKCKGITSERILNGIALVEGMAFGEDCEDYLPKYEQTKVETLTAMRAHLADAQAREQAEAQRLKNEKEAIELAKQKRELVELAAKLHTAQVAITHAAVFAFPAPEPEPIKNIEAQPAQQVLKVTPAMADTTDRDVAVIASPSVGSMGAGQAADAAPAGDPLPIEEISDPILVLINTAELCALVGLDLSVAEIEGFGLKTHVAPQGKRGTFWKASDADTLTDAVVGHLLKAKARRNK